MTVALLALGVAWITGGLIVAALWPRTRELRADATFIVPLALLVGLAVTSVSFTLASLVATRPALWATAIDAAVATSASFYLGRRSGIRAESTPASPRCTWLDWLLATVLAQVMVVAAIVAWRAYAAEPYGGWDAWAIWNLHARMMLRAGTEWPALLSAPQLSWTHPDYPRLIPASVARIWTWCGAENPAASAAVSVTFAGAIVALLIAAIARCRDRSSALLGGLLLVATPFFVTFSLNQHADIPVAAYMLAAVVLGILGEQWLLAGLCAGFAAWTKNEGLLFALGFALVTGTIAWRRGERRMVAALLIGVAIGLIPAVGFKVCLAPANDLMAAPFGPRLGQLVSLQRHALILSSLWRDLRQFGEWRVLPYVAMALPFLAWRARRSLAPLERIGFLVLLVMLIGFYGVYLLSPQDLGWHLDTSLVRLLLQVWPIALLAWALAIPALSVTDAVSPTHRPPWRWTSIVFVMANAMVACGLIVTLSGQRATNELAAKRVGFHTISATLGDGWHGLEQHERDTWAWSRGNASLLLHVPASSSTAVRTLRFSVRSLADREVQIRSHDRVLWRGAVGTNFVAVTLPAIELSPGSHVIELITDAPATPPSNADTRALAFALYNLRIE